MLGKDPYVYINGTGAAHILKDKVSGKYMFDPEILLPVSADLPINTRTDSFLRDSLLAGGWSSPEEWGNWSQGHHAKIVIPYSPRQAYYGRQFLLLTLHFRTFNKQRLTVSWMGKTLYSGNFMGLSSVTIRFPLNKVHEEKISHVTLDLELPDAVAPCTVQDSQDSRELGIGLHSVRLEYLD